MIPLTIEEIYNIMSKKSAIYAKKNLALMIKNTIKSKIIVILPVNIEEMLMTLAI